VTGMAAKASGVRARGRASIAAGTLRADRWWAYPLTTSAVLAAFVAYAAYAAIANCDYYAAPYLSPFYSPCLSFHCGAVPGGPITITLLRTFPVIRDLVTDVSFNYEWALHLPSFVPPDELGRSAV